MTWIVISGYMNEKGKTFSRLHEGLIFLMGKCTICILSVGIKTFSVWVGKHFCNAEL